MMDQPKVSVIVPIYKVEKYLQRCVDSILNQTYQNLEVILVDDGSPDNCGLIADVYSQFDKRIHVIHKENGGLSEARNYGMKQVTGEFTVFVDSDDWLDKNMIRNMVDHALMYKADVIQSAFYYAYDDKLLIDHLQNEVPLVLNKKELMHELVKNEKVKNFAWGKLYKTSLIQDIPFEKGVLFEDVFWAHQVMHRVHTFVLLKQPHYYYYQRNDSIVATYTTRNLDIIKGLKERHRFIKENYKELTDESFKTLLRICFVHYNLLLLNRVEDQRGYYRKEIQQYITLHYPKLKQAVKDDKNLKMELVLFKLHPYIRVFFLIIKKLLRKLRLSPHTIGLKQIEVRSIKNEINY